MHFSRRIREFASSRVLEGRRSTSSTFFCFEEAKEFCGEGEGEFGVRFKIFFSYLIWLRFEPQTGGVRPNFRIFFLWGVKFEFWGRHICEHVVARCGIWEQLS